MKYDDLELISIVKHRTIFSNHSFQIEKKEHTCTRDLTRDVGKELTLHLQLVVSQISHYGPLSLISNIKTLKYDTCDTDSIINSCTKKTQAPIRWQRCSFNSEPGNESCSF